MQCATRKCFFLSQHMNVFETSNREDGEVLKQIRVKGQLVFTVSPIKCRPLDQKTGLPQISKYFLSNFLKCLTSKS